MMRFLRVWGWVVGFYIGKCLINIATSGWDDVDQLAISLQTAFVLFLVGSGVLALELNDILNFILKDLRFTELLASFLNEKS